ncbi:uncharacterized protein LOC111334292 [Stylophora pistillata]|uniref:uncharacterized protein LOC111334292 n=1 Tax=Stylophora pistillata TaxID=50429 RepID=UPI000C05210D|nr:uncharacterized protein LOC111334292 [Stylophora pistillata]
MDPVAFGSQNFMCHSWHMILVAYEIADRLVDFFTTSNYKDGNIINNPKGSVYVAFMVVFSLGMPMTVLRVVLYLHRMHLYRSGDERKDKIHHAINMLMSLAKTLIEALPQATIAKFYFGDYAPTDSSKTLVQTFNTFSVFPFIMFIYYAVYYFHTYEKEQKRGAQLKRRISHVPNLTHILVD